MKASCDWASRGNGFDEQIFGADEQVHIPNSELVNGCTTPFRAPKMQRRSDGGEPSIFAIERVLLWLILSANGAATIFLIVVLLRHPAPASLVPSGLIDGLMLVVGWIAGVICGFAGGVGWMYHLRP